MNKSKSPLWDNSTGANRNWQDTRWKTCCGTRTVPRSQQCVFRIWILRTSHHKAHRAHWITGWDLLEFITLWKTAECSGKRAQITAHSCWTPTRPHANPVDTEIHSAASERGGIDSTCGDQMGPASDRRLLQKGDKRVEFLQAVDSSFKKAKSRFDMLRENPTADAHWALWVDCMREPAQTFFSLHRTSKRDDAQKRLSALRRKLVSEQALRREQMGKFWETYGHLVRLL